MENKKHIGTFHSIEALLYKITELTTRGYKDSDMYAVTNVEDNVSMFRGQAEMEPSGVAADNWLNRFKLFLSGDEVILDTFVRMGFSEQQSRVFYDETKAGGIALFVDAPNQDEIISEMDSSAERGLSGEQLDGQEKTSQQIIDNTVPQNRYEKFISRREVISRDKKLFLFRNQLLLDLIPSEIFCKNMTKNVYTIFMYIMYNEFKI